LDLMMALFYAPGFTGKEAETIRDTMRLVKLLFLLVREGSFQKFEKEFGFEAHDYGPWGGQIYDNIEALKQINLLATSEDVPQEPEEGVADFQVLVQTSEIPVSQDKVSIYCLTEKGKKVSKQVYDKLSTSERENIENIKKKFNGIPLPRLLEYVYSKYPDVTVKSKIKKKVLAKSMFGASPDLPEFKREEEDFRD